MNLFLPPLRPPGAIPEKQFVQKCVHCGQCVTVCPHNSIKFQGGFGFLRLTPIIDPKSVPCYLCMKCPPACPTGALDASLTNIDDVKMGNKTVPLNLYQAAFLVL